MILGLLVIIVEREINGKLAFIQIILLANLHNGRFLTNEKFSSVVHLKEKPMLNETSCKQG